MNKDIDPCIQNFDNYHMTVLNDLLLSRERNSGDYYNWLNDRLCTFYQSVDQSPTPQKAQAQILLQREMLGDPNTWVYPANDFETIKLIVGTLLKSHTNIWISSIIGNDQADPNAPTDRDHPREHAKLFRGPNDQGIKTLNDLTWQWYTGAEGNNIAVYYQKHPELVLKIFPQDDKNLSVGRLIAAKDGLTIQLKKTGHDARDTESGKKVHTYFIRHSPADHSQMLLFCTKPDLPYIQSIVNNSTEFALLEYATNQSLPNLTLLNPEFMIKNLHTPSKAKLAFFTDCIWSTTKETNGRQYQAIKTVIDAIPQMPVLSPTMMFYLNPNEEAITTIIHEASYGNPPHRSYTHVLEHYASLLSIIPDIDSGLLKILNGLLSTAMHNNPWKTDHQQFDTWFAPGSKPRPKDVVEFDHYIKTYESHFPTVQELLNNPTLTHHA